MKKVIVYSLLTVFGELTLIGGALLFGLQLPITALQILLINFFSDSFPAISFAFERHIDVRSTRGVNDGIIDRRMQFLIFFVGALTSVLLFVLYERLLSYGVSLALAQTFIFAALAIYSLLVAFALRSLRASIFTYHPFGNLYLVAGIAVGCVVTIAVVYVPFLQTIFGTVALPPLWLLGVLLVGVLNVAAVEFGKWFYRKEL